MYTIITNICNKFWSNYTFFSGYNGDIICLQEVDSKIFQSTLQPLMDTEGLNGLFYKKGKQVAEGLSCFYRRDRFKWVLFVLNGYIVHCTYST